MATLMAKNVRWYQAITNRMRVCVIWNISSENVMRKTPDRKNHLRMVGLLSRPHFTANYVSGDANVQDLFRIQWRSDGGEEKQNDEQARQLAVAIGRCENDRILPHFSAASKKKGPPSQYAKAMQIAQSKSGR